MVQQSVVGFQQNLSVPIPHLEYSLSRAHLHNILQNPNLLQRFQAISLEGYASSSRAIPMIPRSGELIGSARSASVPVLYSNDSHTRKDFEIERWGEHAMRGSKGAKVIGELRPRKKDVQIPKTTYSSFFNTRLERELKRTHDGKGPNTLIISGLHTDCCVRHTTADAFFRGYETIIAEDAVNSFTELQYRTGLQYLKFWYLADTLPTKKISKLF